MEKSIVSIGFSRPKKFKLFSWLIMLVEGTKYSHTFVTWKCTNINERKVFEAIGSGVRIVSNYRFKEKSHIVEIYQFEVPVEVILWLDRYAHLQAGKPYGYKHILGLTIMKVAKFFGFNIANPFKDGKYSEICLESGAYIVEEGIKVDLPGDIEDYDLEQYNGLIAQYGVPVPQEKIDSINGKS